MLSILGPYKIYAYSAIAMALLGGYWYWHHHIYDQGYNAGIAKQKIETVNVQSSFDAYLASLARITAQREAENSVKAAQVQATNQEVENGYKQALAAIANDRDSLSKRLREYYNQGYCGAILPPTEDHPGTNGTSSLPGGAQSIDELLDQMDRDCAADAAQLTALQEEIRGQLP